MLVVPNTTSDETLISVASQFQHNRFPVVTWKNPGNQAVLLRSAGFVPSSDPQKFGALSNLPAAVLPGKSKLMAGVAGKFAAVGGGKAKAPHFQASAGSGVFNIDVEGYILDVLQFSQNQRKKREKSSLVNEMSVAPKMMHFELPDRSSGGFGLIGSGRRKRNSRTKSWESDDVDLGMKRGRNRNGDSSERSVTPDATLERPFASPEHVSKAQKRRFTIANVIHKVRSPNRRRRYKMANSSAELLTRQRQTDPAAHSERDGEVELLTERDRPAEDDAKEQVRERGEGESSRGDNLMIPKPASPRDERDKSTHESSEEQVTEKTGAEGESEREKKQRDRESLSLTSSEHDSGDFATAMRERGLEDLETMSPTRGFPKTLSMRRGSSNPDLTSHVARGDEVAVDNEDEITLDDIEVREKREKSVSPDASEERRTSTIDWERMSEGAEEATPTDLESRPSTSTPDIPTSPGSRLESTGDQDGSSEVWTPKHAKPEKTSKQVCTFYVQYNTSRMQCIVGSLCCSVHCMWTNGCKIMRVNR